MRRIVVIRLSALGDVVLATPAIAALGQAFPDAHLTWVTSAPYAPLIEGLAFVDAAVPWDRDAHEGAMGNVRLAEQIRKQSSEPIDLVLDLQNKPRSAILARMLAPGRVVTLRKRGFLEALRAVLGGDRIITRPHTTRLYFRALRDLGVSEPEGSDPLRPCVFVSEAAREKARRLLKKDDSSVLLALAPGAKWETKRWPPEKLGAVGAELLGSGLADDFVLVGGPGEEAVLDSTAKALPRQPVLNTIDLDPEHLAAVISDCDILIVGDSGPAHLASAVGTPSVVLFGPTSPSRWGPALADSRAVGLQLSCSPCSNHGSRSCHLGHHACMVDLDPKDVVAAASSILERPRPARGTLEGMEGRS